ncbi:GGDEF domain-containing protein [bacterium SCSIO 12696]|nr:GGDEF domain-containing protein [bacterium SCSIO 12696]
MKNLIIKLGRLNTTAIFTVACIAVSVLITAIIMAMFAGGLNKIGLAIAIIAPAIIAPLATWQSTGLIIKIAQLETEARKLATYDPLTELMTRRAFMESALSVMKVNQRNHAPLSLAYIDIDNFKKINDSHGHQVGDSVLEQLGRLIRNQVRGCDLVGRIGGEEFALAMADTNLLGAMHLAEKLRYSIAEYQVQHQDLQLQCTVSIGISTMDWNNPISFEQLCNQADSALYRAKKSGKNRITHAVMGTQMAGPAALF